MKKFKILLLALLLPVATSLSCNLPLRSLPAATVTPIPVIMATPSPVALTPLFTPTAQTATAESGATPPLVATAEPSSTATPLPETATLPPTPLPPTPTAPAMRSGPSALAYRMFSPPLIDGDWNDLPPESERPANIVVFGKDAWLGKDDLSASFRIAWDQNNLYIGVKVWDQRYVQESTGANLYQGDSIEILLDTDVKGDFYVQSLDNDDFQLGLSGGPSPIGKNMEAYLWYPSGKAGPVKTIKMAAVSTPLLYRIEAAIPWDLFGIAPVRGMHFGFALSVSDNDTPGKPGQKAMVSSAPSRVLTNPTTWGDLTLTR